MLMELIKLLNNSQHQITKLQGESLKVGLTLNIKWKEVSFSFLNILKLRGEAILIILIYSILICPHRGTDEFKRFKKAEIVCFFSWNFIFDNESREGRGVYLFLKIGGFFSSSRLMFSKLND